MLVEEHQNGNNHLGRNMQRIREIIGMKQATLAQQTSMSQQNISKLEQSVTIPDDTLEVVAKGLGVTPEFIKHFNEERAINNIQNQYNNSTHNQHYKPSIHNFKPSFHNESLTGNWSSIFEQMLADKNEQIRFLQQELVELRIQLRELINKMKNE